MSGLLSQFSYRQARIPGLFFERFSKSQAFGQKTLLTLNAIRRQVTQLDSKNPLNKQASR